MKVVQYALIARDVDGKRLGVTGTSCEMFTFHGKVTPRFHSFCASVLALYPAVERVEAVAWKPEADMETLSVLLRARPLGGAGQIAYSFPPFPEAREVQRESEI